MPSKIDPNDWDTFFSADGPRRSGPIGIFVRTALVLGVIGGIGYGLSMFNTQLEAKKQQTEQTSIALAPTRTAQAFANAIQQTAEAQPTATPNLPTGRVLATVPLRVEPKESAAGKGNINPNDVVRFIKSQNVGDQLWWNISVDERANTSIEGADQGTVGWVPATALTEPSEPPPPAPDGTPVAAQLPPIKLSGASLNLYRDPQTSISVSRDGSWNPQGLPTLPLSIFLSPSLDSGEGVVAAKVLGNAQDRAGFLASVNQVAQVLCKPGTTPQVAITGDAAQLQDGTVTFTRLVGGQDITIKARYLAKPAPGNSVGVVLAFVPDNSYGENEAVLTQIVQGAIFQ
ncbi:MAG: hypothetical protein H0T53_04690 [Herpetosiphonaceae bacterium]|nr:hypothetical protein [Herpetosiphonaceae bacterium]